MVYASEPVRITSSAKIGSTGVDVRCEGKLEFPGGGTATWSASFESRLPCDAIIKGTAGEIRLPEFWMARKATLRVDGDERTTRCPYRASGLQFEAREVMDCLNRGLLESPTMRWADSLSVLKQMDQMRASWSLSYPGESTPL